MEFIRGRRERGLYMNKAHILNQVGQALDCQFQSYTWEDMIDDIDNLTKEEKEFAKENICYKAYIL